MWFVQFLLEFYLSDPRAVDIMKAKAHGTCATGVPAAVRWGVDASLADRICCFNRHYAEHSGYWLRTAFLREVRGAAAAVCRVWCGGAPWTARRGGRSTVQEKRRSTTP